jgi:hypothetical protein
METEQYIFQYTDEIRREIKNYLKSSENDQKMARTYGK